MVQMLGSRNFHQGGGGGGGGKGPGQSDKKALTTIFLVLSLFYRSQMVNFKEIYRFSRLQSPQLILQKSNGQFQRNLSFFKAPDGVQFFPGVQLFPGGVQCLCPIETHLICDFPEGVRTPCPPSGSALGAALTASWLRLHTIHYLIWAWQTLIDRRMYHPFIVIYLIISVYYRNLRCFNR